MGKNLPSQEAQSNLESFVNPRKFVNSSPLLTSPGEVCLLPGSFLVCVLP